MESYDVLVILLSVALAMSLFIWIVAGVLVIQVFIRLKKASQTARAAVENVEQFTSQLKTAGRATAIGTIVGQITKVFKGRK